MSRPLKLVVENGAAHDEVSSFIPSSGMPVFWYGLRGSKEHCAISQFSPRSRKKLPSIMPCSVRGWAPGAATAAFCSGIAGAVQFQCWSGEHGSTGRKMHMLEIVCPLTLTVAVGHLAKPGVAVVATRSAVAPAQEAVLAQILAPQYSIIGTTVSI